MRAAQSRDLSAYSASETSFRLRSCQGIAKRCAHISSSLGGHFVKADRESSGIAGATLERKLETIPIQDFFYHSEPDFPAIGLRAQERDG